MFPFFYAWLPARRRDIILCPTHQAANNASHSCQATQRRKWKRGQRRGWVWLGGDNEVGKQILFEDDPTSELSEKNIICQRPPKCNAQQ